MVDYPAALAHGLRRMITCGRVSKEMDSKSLAELWKMVIIPRQGKSVHMMFAAVSSSDWFHPFSSPTFPAFFPSGYCCRFEMNRQRILLLGCECLYWAVNVWGSTWPSLQQPSRSKQIEFDYCLRTLERQAQKNLIKVRKNDREVNHFVVWVVQEVWKD